MLLLLLIIFLIILCLIERELDGRSDSVEFYPENCQKCGFEVDGDHLICPNCSSLLREHCIACGKTKFVSHQYCPWCGGESHKGRSLYAA